MMNELFNGIGDEGYHMRASCSACGSSVGIILTTNGQDCVRCLCGKFQYNAPKVETGREVRTVTTIHEGIKPKQRSRILERATGRCELCGAKGVDLHVGHMLSVEAGMANGLTEVELNHDDNLACLCAECNLGMGKITMPLRLCVAIVKARAK